ncbi:MAG: beta-galactosidase, partial [Planctomycetes bacterium]|nr:beta-galactosidase [Planctomycetota bacterium]
MSEPAIPRPEHPRPDLQRDLWLNLNGPWEFEMDKDGAIGRDAVKPDMPLGRTILVPFCPESRLSGVGE